MGDASSVLLMRGLMRSDDEWIQSGRRDHRGDIRLWAHYSAALDHYLYCGVHTGQFCDY